MMKLYRNEIDHIVNLFDNNTLNFSKSKEMNIDFGHNKLSIYLFKNNEQVEIVKNSKV